jgi:exopolysaccharide biosynthesis polyprenyl glycosylphosphotransferase
MSDALVTPEVTTAPAGLPAARLERPARDLVPPTLDATTGFLHGADVETPRRDSSRRRALAGADVLALMLAYLAMRALVPPAGGESVLLAAALPLWVILNKALRLYDRDANLLHKSSLNELPSVVQSISLGAALIFLLAPLLAVPELHRRQIVAFWAAACLLTPGLRYAARRLVRRSFPPERVLVVGSGEVAELVGRKLAGHPELGATVVATIDEVDAFERVCRDGDIERVVIAFSSLSHERLLDTIRMSKRLHLKITVVPRLFEVIGHGVEIDQIEGLTLLGLRGLKRTKSTLMLKRAIDVLGAAAGLVALAPLLAVLALAIKLDSPGPALYSHRRVGRGNREFRMWKLRSMVEGADHMRPGLEHLNELHDGVMFKIADDPRITRVGRLMRRASLDELPQLWNVLRGEMSLVGPRPLLPAEDDHVIGWHRARLDLTPGLTGPWQVLGRSAIPFHEMVKLDYLYVAEWSLWNDVKLLVRTLPVVIGRRGA